MQTDVRPIEHAEEVKSDQPLTVVNMDKTLTKSSYDQFLITSDNPICPNQGEPNRSSIPLGPGTPKFSMFQNLGKRNTTVQLISQTDLHATEAACKSDYRKELSCFPPSTKIMIASISSMGLTLFLRYSSDHQRLTFELLFVKL